MQKNGSGFRIFLVFVGVMLLLAVIPLVISATSSPLQPPQLAETATIYVPTQSAYETRSAVDDFTTPSIFEVLPTEDAGAANQPKALPISYVREVHALQPTIIPIVGISKLELATYRCGFESDATGEFWPENTEFPVLGWNTDSNDTVYFLIDDDSSRLQTWLQADVSVTLTVSDYTAIYPLPSSCRTWVIPARSGSEVPSTPSGSTSPIPLPQIKTATPEPPKPVTLSYTNAEASALIAESVTDLKNPSVAFSPSNVTVVAQVEGSGPLGIRVTGGVSIIGTLNIESGKLVMDVTTVLLNNGDITDSDDGRRAETGVNNWLRSLLIGREVTSFELSDGLLVIDALEVSGNLFFSAMTATADAQATLSATQTGTPAPQVTGTLTATITLPEIRNITFTPEVARAREITSANASQSAQDAISLLQDIHVAFSSDGAEITGRMRLPNTPVSQNITLKGNFVAQNGNLVFELASIKAGSLDLAGTEVGQQIVNAINLWVPMLADNKRVEHLQMGNGILKINP